MALAHRAAPRLTLNALIAEASDFTRDAWRDCWLVMALLVGVQTYLFARGHITSVDWHKTPLDWVVPVLTLLYVPLYGGLYRAALGGRPLAGLGPGGLQWKGVEWRLIAVGVVIAFLIGLSAIPFMVANLIAALVMGLHSSMSMGPLGGWARWTPAAVAIWLVFFWVMAPRVARLALGWAYSSAREKTEPFAGWGPGKASGWPIAFALVLAFAPMLLGWLAVYALTLVEPDVLAGEYWPVPEAVGAGLLLAVLKVAIVAPLSVGVLSGAWWLLEGDQEAQAPIAVAPRAVAPSAPPRRDHRPFIDSLGPATVAAMATAAATLAAREADELGLHHTEVDRNAAPPPEPDAPKLDAPDPADTSGAEPIVADAAAQETSLTHQDDEANRAVGADREPEREAVLVADVKAPEPQTPPVALEPNVGMAEPAAQDPDPRQSLAIGVPKPGPTRDFAALSDWPHSVLPAMPAARFDTAAATPTKLAYTAEAAHPSDGGSEPR